MQCRVCVINILKLLENFSLDSCHDLHLLFFSNLMNYCTEHHKLRKNIYTKPKFRAYELIFFFSFFQITLFYCDDVSRNTATLSIRKYIIG